MPSRARPVRTAVFLLLLPFLPPPPDIEHEFDPPPSPVDHLLELIMNVNPPPSPHRTSAALARLWGHESIWLHVKRSNAAAAALYASMGYTPVESGGMRLLPGPLSQVRVGGCTWGWMCGTGWGRECGWVS